MTVLRVQLLPCFFCRLTDDLVNLLRLENIRKFSQISIKQSAKIRNNMLIRFFYVYYSVLNQNKGGIAKKL